MRDVIRDVAVTPQDSDPFEEDAPLDDLINRKRWYALYTRSRHEKLINRELNKKGIETYLPTRKIKRRWSDRSKIIEEPLFRSYLFIHIPYQERLSVLRVKGSVRLVGRSADRPMEVAEGDIHAVRRFAHQELQVDPFPYLKAGQKVYVRSGPLKGIEGYMIRKDRQCRLVISFDLLMQSVSIQIDGACVEPV